MQRVLSLNQALVESFGARPQQPAVQLNNIQPAALAQHPMPVQPPACSQPAALQAAPVAEMQPGHTEGQGVQCIRTCSTHARSGNGMQRTPAADPDKPCCSRLPCIDEGAESLASVVLDRLSKSPQA